MADGNGRIALIVGAGCSLDAPTSLELSSVYARRVHEALVADNVLTEGECTDPEDLSLLASLVFDKTGAQEPVVSRLPRGAFRDAQANEGYRVAAALLLEGAVAALLTLNFDLAMNDALRFVGAGDAVSVIAEPESLDTLGTRVVVYLHRNANEADEENWVLRAEVIDAAWKGRWEEVIAQRVLTSPVVVFAGLGSPAGVLTESIKWIRGCLDGDGHRAYVVDPSAEASFKEALALPEGAHIQMGWGPFMRCLADRLATEQKQALAEACQALCAGNRWPEEAANIDELCETFFERNLLGSGRQRAAWLLRDREYLPDDQQVRDLIAYLLLGLGVAKRHCDVTLNVRRDGIVELRRDGALMGSCLPVSAEGTKHWTAMEPRIRQALAAFTDYERPSTVLLGSLQGTLPDDVTPPDNIVFDDSPNSIVTPATGPAYFTVDSVREDPTLADRMVA